MALAHHDQGHCGLRNFLLSTATQTVVSYNSNLAQARKLIK